MGHTLATVNAIRSQIAADDPVLTEARKRRDSVLSIASKFPGALRTFNSGSLAHLTVNHPVSDADCGVVLDRRSHPDLGPDSKGRNGPSKIVAEVREFVCPELRKCYPDVRCRLTKRAILVTFSAPMTTQEHPDEEQDPSVDLIVSLTRAKGARGLWIPNLAEKEWDASDPEEHTRLLTEGPATLRRERRRAIRLAKAQNAQFNPPTVSSFNLEALAHMAVKDGMSLPEALLAIWEEGAKQFTTGLTPDPADVSDPIKVKDRSLAHQRMSAAAAAAHKALDHDAEEETVREALSSIYFDYVDAPTATTSKAAFASSLRREDGRVRLGAGGLTLGAAGETVLKSTRAYGDIPHP
jgi:hypothetical protein